MLIYSADQTPPYPQARRQSTSPGPQRIDGSQQEYVIQTALPYADNLVTVYAFNIKRNIQGTTQMTANRSIAIGEFDIM